MPAREAGLDIVPVLDPLFALFPAPEHIAAVELAVEIDQTLLESLEHATHRLELGKVCRDAARDVLDATAQRELFGRFAPLGAGLGGGEFILRDELAPLWIESSDVRDYLPH